MKDTEGNSVFFPGSILHVVCNKVLMQLLRVRDAIFGSPVHSHDYSSPRLLNYIKNHNTDSTKKILYFGDNQQNDTVISWKEGITL